MISFNWDFQGKLAPLRSETSVQSWEQVMCTIFSRGRNRTSYVHNNRQRRETRKSQNGKHPTLFASLSVHRRQCIVTKSYDQYHIWLVDEEEQPWEEQQLGHVNSVQCRDVRTKTRLLVFVKLNRDVQVVQVTEMWTLPPAFLPGRTLETPMIKFYLLRADGAIRLDFRFSRPRADCLSQSCGSEVFKLKLYFV